MLWIHLASVAAFAGATLTLLVLTATITPVSPLSYAAVRQAMSIVAESVAVPALLLMVVSGMLLVVARPTLIDARWVWAKTVLGAVVVGVAFALVQPSTRRATALSVQEAMGSVVQAEAMLGANAKVPMDSALQREAIGQWATLALLAAATALAVWRPRLGQGPQGPSSD
jgi:hypothetical protein